MAQVLKPQSREQILEAGKQEFMEHGYENSSMRRIALRSKMTVGNLYRYFASKEDLNLVIVHDTVEEINELLSSLTENNLKLNNQEVNFDVQFKKLKEKTDSLSDGLAEIFHNHPREVRILMMNSQLNSKIMDWLSSFFARIIETGKAQKDERLLKSLSRCYSVSLCAGFRELFQEKIDDIDDMKRMIRAYLNSFMSMLNNPADPEE